MRLFATMLLMGMAAAGAHSQEKSSRDQLNDTQGKLEQAQSREQALAKKTGSLEKELTQTQQELVKIAEAVQRNEKSLTEGEDKLRIVTREASAKQDALEARKKELMVMVQAAIRLSHVPPQAALMMPGDFDESLKAARILSTLNDTIRREAESIHAQVLELAALKSRIEQDRARLAEDQKTLKTRRAQLASKLKDRKTLAQSLGGEQEGLKKKIAELSRQADDLKGLIGELERTRRDADSGEDKKRDADRLKKGAWPKASTRLRSFERAKGRARMPAAGRIKNRFGQQLARNETSKGVTLMTRDDAPVVAPYDAEVVFVGPFLNYGKMVILRHSDEYHTLLAGFDRVNVNAGDFLLEGEPIGAMGDDASSTELYVELRNHNQPIDPAPWITALK